ncbi:MAG TPA: methyltransferase domain-containing protein [Chryseosolibacter sp.]|nr:methyltransferase domain-containing protein [Chryseosolibacter sp.]
MGSAINYFSPRTAAERYSIGRPHFHANTIKHVTEYLRLDRKVENALDIACGTGLSSKALLEIAANVYGTDLSQEMLNLAAEREKIHYSLAPAERQPFADSTFDLITVSSGVHWFDIDRFLTEARRLLKSRSWLVLYENYFISEMAGNENFTSWYPDVYLKKFPSPPRNDAYPWTNENLADKGFILTDEERFKNPVAFNKKQLALYFTTQSNIIAAVERKQTTYEQAETWLGQELARFFDRDDTAQTIMFGNWIKYLQKI